MPRHLPENRGNTPPVKELLLLSGNYLVFLFKQNPRVSGYIFFSGDLGLTLRATENKNNQFL